RFIEESVRVTNSVTAINDRSGGSSQITRYKTEDETVNNSATLQDDDDLSFAIGANEVWAVEIYVQVNSSSSADFKYALSVPSGATLLATQHPYWDTDDTLETSYQTSSGIGASGTQDRGVLIKGTV